MSVSAISTPCECQAVLEATLDEHGYVTEGVAVRPGTGRRALAPAYRSSVGRNRFDITWQCPECGRNTVRLFWEAD